MHTEFPNQSVDIRTDGPFQNKLNVNAPEFKFPQFIQHSKSSGNIQQHATQITNSSSNQPILFPHPFDMLNAKVSAPSSERVQTNVSINISEFI